MYNILSIVIGIFYIFLGIFVITKKFFVVKLDGVIPFVLGGLLIAYGIFRVIRAIVFIRRKDEE
ncbi:MAG: C4-dicarboxylate ABC transporter [Cloacibacterium sp.]|jgi:uncharacterized membrane protein|nr:C4-dicarboxylate ABC transporter [Cloacibacterium sp.]